jgi:hypothetical protein
MDGSLQCAAFLREIATPVGRDTPGQRAVDLGQSLLRDDGDQLRATPGADEGDRADALHGEVGQQVGGLRCGRAAHGGPLLAVQFGERGFPQGEDQFTAR